MERVAKTGMAVTGVGLVGLMLCVALLSASLHAEAPAVANLIDTNARDICRSGIYIAPARGTMLIMVKNPLTGQTAGQIIRFFEYYYSELVPADTIYECTAFEACDQYWCRVVKRDGYILLADAKWTMPIGIFTALSALVLWLRSIGRDNVADGIEDA